MFVWSGATTQFDRLAPTGNQTKVEYRVELTLLGITVGLPFGDHVRQSLSTQPKLTVEQGVRRC